jgi:glycosyltransferase involved in cell wall biosynthesis
VRVLSVIPGPAFGGAHNQALTLHEPLANRGIEVSVVLPEEAERAAARLRSGGMHVETRSLHRLRATRDPQEHLALAKSFGPEVRELAALVHELGADVVQSHGVTNPHGAVAARRARVASVWQIFDSRAPIALRRAIMPFVLRLTDASTVWGHALARMHPGLERLGDRLTVVFPPVDMGRFATAAESRAAARAELGVNDDQVLVGSIGVLNPQKGHEYTIRTAAAVQRLGVNARFRILGASSPSHGHYEADLRREIGELGLEEVISVVDPGTRIAELIQAFDVFLMTSVPRSEGMPTVILEAMACAKPVVATDVAAVGELVEHGVTGYLVAPRDIDAIASRVIDLCSDHSRREQMGERGRALAQSAFSLDRLADLHASAYAAAVEHNAHRR